MYWKPACFPRCNNKCWLTNADKYQTPPILTKTTLIPAFLWPLGPHDWPLNDRLHTDSLSHLHPRTPVLFIHGYSRPLSLSLWPLTLIYPYRLKGWESVQVGMLTVMSSSTIAIQEGLSVTVKSFLFTGHLISCILWVGQLTKSFLAIICVQHYITCFTMKKIHFISSYNWIK